MNENKKLKRFKKYCNETILDFKAGPCDENAEYIIKQYQTVVDFEKVKPKIMPPEKSIALVFINQYLEKSIAMGSAVLTPEMIFGGAMPQVAELDKEHEFMHNYIKERYEFMGDGQIITLNKSHSFLKV